MAIPTPSGGVRLVGALIRRADESLAHGAARNAAASVADRRALHLDELRTLRDLRAIESAGDGTAPSRLGRSPRRPGLAAARRA